MQVARQFRRDAWNTKKPMETTLESLADKIAWNATSGNIKKADSEERGNRSRLQEDHRRIHGIGSHVEYNVSCPGFR